MLFGPLGPLGVSCVAKMKTVTLPAGTVASTVSSCHEFTLVLNGDHTICGAVALPPTLLPMPMRARAPVPGPFSI